MFNLLARQFEKPDGLLGKITGLIMFLENRKINRWSIKRLHIKKGDRILEIGYGPGYAVKEIMESTRKVTLDGIDLSESMKKTAEKRNQCYIREGKVKLYSGDISSYQPNHLYNKVLSVNNYPLWEKTNQSLKRIYHMMAAGGQITLTVQPREEGAGAQTARDLGESMTRDLTEAGFRNISVAFKKVRPVLTVSVSAHK
ncbi:methyltransferase domain-containing protein [Mesobacillus foraminis]|uniref:SAM-dependent methyltransferase n=1 Tax=Mesobacillus foraminis TaxID=279826 RepID=UPI001BEB0C64|nr:methyltransferase domain-containing protein [Mesobacillus foraminis]MBT2757101.1 methyltransferase domain-containing protein [Mesobacillus foraminis]